jgi:cbb3-type cytochrome oxidase maturation protein
MGVIILLIIVSVLVAGGFLIAFLWSVSTGQMEDDYTPSEKAWSILHTKATWSICNFLELNWGKLTLLYTSFLK